MARISMILSLVVMALANVACSTPVVPDKADQSSDTSWWAYQSCLDSLPRGASTAYCDKVNGEEQTRLSYDEYLWNQQQGRSSSSTAYGTSYYGFSKAMKDSAYRNYLSTLDADTQASLAKQWTKLAEEAKAAQANE